MRRLFLFLVTHAAALAIGFALGVYFLPILTAPDGPEDAALMASAEGAAYTGTFTRDLRGSDFLHWGEGTVALSDTHITHMGELAPGPDYKLYLLKEFVEHEDEFLPLKDDARLIGDVKTFDGLILEVPEGIDVSEYNTVLIWCESFGEFITAAKYQ